MRQSDGDHPRIENVFVLCTGRCGSTTFIRACEKIENFTASHESRSKLLGSDRICYPKRHIEADNRLTWFLPRLAAKVDPATTLFVHLTRSHSDVVKSFTYRKDGGIMKAYRDGILMREGGKTSAEDDFLIAEDYVRCVNEHIDTFLATQVNVMRLELERISQDFPEFWRRIGAIGSLSGAMEQLEIHHNKIDVGALRKRSSFFGHAKRLVKNSLWR